jgi:hypothetical protein
VGVELFDVDRSADSVLVKESVRLSVNDPECVAL